MLDIKKAAAGEFKTYQLLDQLAPTAPIFIQVAKDQKIRLNQRKSWRPYMVATIVDAEGNTKMIRFKIGVDSIYLTDQIKAGVDANAKFTEAERQACHFVNGQLTTNLKILQEFLEASPQFNEYSGSANPEDIKPAYKILDVEVVKKQKNSTFRDNLRAANSIEAMSIEDAKSLLVAINGPLVPTPDDLIEAQNELVDLMDTSEEAFKKILKFADAKAQGKKGYKPVDTSGNVDHEINVLINLLLQNEVLSFDAVPDQIAFKRDGKWEGVKELDASYKPEDRARYLVEFLSSEAGEPLLNTMKMKAVEIEELEEEKS